MKNIHILLKLNPNIKRGHKFEFLLSIHEKKTPLKDFNSGEINTWEKPTSPSNGPCFIM